MPLRIFFAAAVLVVVAAVAIAHEYVAGSIAVDHPWARASIGRAPNSAAFLTIENRGDEPDALLGVEGTIAGRLELHTHINDGGVMMMRPVDRIEVPAHSTVSLEPGGMHIMLIGLKRKLEDGERVPLVLVFEKAGRVAVELAVEKMGAAMDHGKHMGDGQHMKMPKAE
ncbi:MAG: copper chaperone PCu(A)C [Pseudomonadota bacterium]|nr:copper chaperone PCu(A)C [Pseudomonadota bacterium]